MAIAVSPTSNKVVNLSVTEKYSQDQLELIKRTVCRGATNDELELFLYTCDRTGLDPLMKQIHAVKRKDTMTMQTSIDGFRSIAERTKRYAPGMPTKYDYKPDGSLLNATAFVKKLTDDGTWHEVSYTAFFDEFKQSFNGTLGKFWLQMPHVMLAKCAEAGALRRAFPYEMSKIYTHEEMHNGLNKTSLEDSPIEIEELRKEREYSEDNVDFPIEGTNDPLDVEAYFEYLATKYSGKTIPQLKRLALQNLNAFWEKFHVWLAKRPKDVELLTDN